METIVITGSTRGIGLGLARELLKRNRKVILNGRKEELVRTQTAALKREFPMAQVHGFAADVTQYEQVQQLWDFAVQTFGKVDIWINNAGVMNSHVHTWELEPKEMQSIVDINLIGPMFACKVAIQGMLKAGGGYIYNFEGFGSNGRQFHPYMTPYGSTKSALRYLTRSLKRELRGTSVKIGTIAPGIVITDLLRDPYIGKPKEWEKAKKIFNILGDYVETVTPFIADSILKEKKSGASIEWLSFAKVLGRFLSASFSKRDLFLKSSVQS
ncbi:MAG: SDR family NAD(P)-dependent oxidoreductase [Proteobacteria bacterium]|nr:SDR family NAD(P)-dependent oxidoreductase [Pseudomonadota bacterium]